MSHCRRPEIFNTDQGSQYTSNEFTDVLKQNEIRISMDGQDRALDNIFIERLWRIVKYEEVYLNHYESVWKLENSLTRWFDFYRYRRRHSSLGYRFPAEVYFDRERTGKRAAIFYENKTKKGRLFYCSREGIIDNNRRGVRRMAFVISHNQNGITEKKNSVL